MRPIPSLTFPIEYIDQEFFYFQLKDRILREIDLDRLLGPDFSPQ